MKGMKLYKKATGGYLSALEQSKPELFQTIKSYRDRLSGGEKETFDKRANIQYSATMNMPKNQRDAYIASIEKEYSKPSDVQFKQIKSSLGEKFKPTYTYIARDSDRPAATTGYYRDLSKEIEESDKKLKNLMITETEKRTRPQYEVTYPSATTYGSPRPSEMTTNLPKDAVLTRGLYGQEYLQSPIQNRTSMGQQNTNPQYRRVGDQQYTVSTTRAQRAGDPEYDKQAASLKRLQTRHSFRNMPQFTGQGNLTSQNVYQQLGMAKSGGLKEDIQKIKNKKQQFSNGGGVSVRGTKFKGVF
jgi:hypothetical protein